MEDLGLFVKDILAVMDIKNRVMVLQFSVDTILRLVDGISDVVGERKEYNEAYIDYDPGVIPHHLFHILSRDLYVYLQRCLERIGYTFSIEEI